MGSSVTHVQTYKDLFTHSTGHDCFSWCNFNNDDDDDDDDDDDESLTIH